jgi:sugar phosphate isomerase/epimerase
MAAVGIEFITVFSLPPLDYVNLAGDLGCPTISVMLEPFGENPYGYAPFSLRTDAGLRRDMLAAMRDRGVSVSLGEGFLIMPDLDVRTAYARDLEIMAELGAPLVNAVSMDPDLNRSFDQFAVVAEMAAAVGLKTATEFAPCFPSVQDLSTALAAVRHVGRPDFGIVLDTMHHFRSGGTGADIAKVDPKLFAYVQLCDAPKVPTIQDYMEEAMYERRAPGDGDAPLFDYLKALPRDLVVNVEVPLREEVKAGRGHKERVGRIIEQSRALLARLEPATA